MKPLPAAWNETMISTLKGIVLAVTLIVILGLQIAAAVVRWNEPADASGVDGIDIRPQVEQMVKQQQEARMAAIRKVVDRRFAAATVIAGRLRDRWADAQRRGLVGEIGVIYIPTDRELKFDGSIPEIGTAQLGPPASGWYIVLRKFKTPSGRIEAKTEINQARAPVAATRPKPVTPTSPAVR